MSPADAVDCSARPTAVVMVQGELLSCGSVFSSITYLDLEAGVKPNLEWLILCRHEDTPTRRRTSFSSLPLRFTVAVGFCIVEGNVYAGTGRRTPCQECASAPSLDR